MASVCGPNLAALLVFMEKSVRLLSKQKQLPNCQGNRQIGGARGALGVGACRLLNLWLGRTYGRIGCILGYSEKLIGHSEEESLSRIYKLLLEPGRLLGLRGSAGSQLERCDEANLRYRYRRRGRTG